MSSLTNKVTKGLNWIVTGQILKQIIQFFITVVLARILLPQEYGLLGMILVLTGFAQLFRDLGLGAAIIQKQNVSEDYLNTAFCASVLAGLFLTVLFILLSPIIASFYHEMDLIIITIAISFNFAIGSLSIIHNSICQKNLNFKTLTLIDLMAVVPSGIIAILLAYLGFGIWSLVIQSLLMTSISVILFWILVDWRPTISLKIEALKELMRFSSGLLGFNFVNYWSRNLDRLLIGKYIGSNVLGIYNRAYSLMLLPLSQITWVTTKVMFPALSEIQSEKTRVKNIYLRAIGIIALIAFPMMVGLFFVAEPFIILVYGEKWKGVIPILKIFCITGLLQSVSTTTGWIYTSQGRTDLMFKWGLFSSIVCGVSFVIGLNWGIFGIAISYTIANVLLLYPGWIIPGRLIGLRFYEILSILKGPFFCSAVMGSILWIIGFKMPAFWPSYLILFLKIFCGIATYILLIWGLNLNAFQNLINIYSVKINCFFRKKVKSKPIISGKP